MRAFCVGFIALFLMMLMIPLVCIDLASGRASVEENRMLANPPQLAEIKNRPGLFIRHFDDWIKDSTGFRKQLVSLYNLYNRNPWLSGVRYTDGRFDILVGEKGHHFNAWENSELIAQFQGKPRVTGEQLAAAANKLKEVKTYLDRRNIPLVVMLCPNKETIYPEYYPKSIRRGPEPVQLDVMTQYLKEHTGADLFNVKDVLLEEKKNYVLYRVSPPGDFLHYNEIAGFFAYRELMGHITRYFPKLVPYEVSDLLIKQDATGASTASLKTEKLYKKLDNAFFDEGALALKRALIDNHAYENADPELPVLLAIRDSFFHEPLMCQYLAQHFSKTICIHYMDSEGFYEYISLYKPDIVVFEAVDYQLDLFCDYIGQIPELPAAE